MYIQNMYVCVQYIKYINTYVTYVYMHYLKYITHLGTHTAHMSTHTLCGELFENMLKVSVFNPKACIS